ncbi:MAG: molybdopterin molybdotransferase MoeA [Bacteroidota bacterium]|jgi:molybdopterin molybdotransferase|nr:molybdopterin molybdotransferase MoeA [Cytophagales bacterium]MCE2958418.1 molybdopterin molybdotransferase MoeA [Flammeovirgaceae bacterium]MCZ8071659.1 molybdopterin molybdotransferase MoeA [Cytophagales bacterium]
MISVEEATDIIHSNLLKTSVVEVEFTKAVGRVLAQPIPCDRDLPPFNRATMDGIAIQYSSLSNYTRFQIQSTQAAGDPQQTLNSPAHCIEIMTGAMLPHGTDTIIPYEQLSLGDAIAAINSDSRIERGQNIHRQGTDAKKDDIILKPGIKLSSAEIAVLASVGKSHVRVFEWPAVAIVSTGNELVDVADTPLPHQVRKSNSYALHAALVTIGCSASIFHLPDDQTKLEAGLRQIISKHQVVILSGGVSKGKFDYVPQVLAAIGIKKHFHQVAQKPGKPFCFGSNDNTFVFGLPGNPVSTYLCFYRYILPWLWKSFGIEHAIQKAVLREDYSFKPPLTYFLQVKTQNENGQLMAYPHTGEGSGDFANLIAVNGFLELPPGKDTFKKNEVFSFIQFRF